LYVLPDAECSLEDRNTLLDSRQIENFRPWIGRGLQVRVAYGIHQHVDRLVALCPRRIDMDVRRQPHLCGQHDDFARIGNCRVMTGLAVT